MAACRKRSIGTGWHSSPSRASSRRVSVWPRALHASDRLEEALPHYLQVTETEPGFVEAWLWRAEALIQLERYAEAREWVTAARRVHPEHSDIRRLAEAFDAAPRP